MRNKSTIFISTILFLIFAYSCKNGNNMSTKNTDTVKLTINKYPDRVQKSVIYEVNIRQYTPEGTFKEFEKHLDRLKNLGVDILWIMPIQPVGLKNRKGDLGSYYSVQNYTAVNPEFGSLDDFKDLVQKAHKLGMLVIIDWVANHTSWDNVWITQHPDWYTHDTLGNIISPVPDWTDVADLNYDNPKMRHGMVDAMKYWVKTADVDGFRCDVAFMVPTTFWDSARVELEKVKPMFMLAEAEEPELMDKAFDMCYSWDLYHTMTDVAHFRKSAVDLQNYFTNPPKKFNARTIHMTFTSNHDENSWNGTDSELYAGNQEIFTVLSYVIPGMPLIYSGQEACNEKRLRFFYKDTIDWKDCHLTNVYKKMIELKHNNQALWNVPFGSDIQFLNTNMPKQILAFVRQKDNDKIVCLFNLCKKTNNFTFTDNKATGKYTDYFNGKDFEIQNKKSIELQPWSYLILIGK